MGKIGLQGTMSTQGITVVRKYLPKTTFQFSDTTQDSALLLQDHMAECNLSDMEQLTARAEGSINKMGWNQHILIIRMAPFIIFEASLAGRFPDLKIPIPFRGFPPTTRRS